MIEFGGEFLKVTPLNFEQWWVSVVIGIGILPVGIIARMIPCPEAPEDFFDNSIATEEQTKITQKLTSFSGAKVAP